MRRRSRDITVFNLSMMDVITGAMGAFLIVMVVLARYYESDPGNKENVEQLKAELSQARDRLREIDLATGRDGPQSRNIKQALNRAKRNLRNAERDAEDLREQLDQAEQDLKRQKKLVERYKKRRAFAVASNWNCRNVKVDIYVWDSMHDAATKTKTAPMKPAERQDRRWRDDFFAEWDSGGSATWLVSGAATNAEFKVYVKVVDATSLKRPCRVVTTVTHSTAGTRSVDLLSRAQPWAYVAHLRQETGKKSGHYKFETVDKAAIEAEKRTISGRSLGG